jgi:hypothetical protein
MTYESEKITRKKRIDQQLKAAGWLIIPYAEGMDLSCGKERQEIKGIFVQEPPVKIAAEKKVKYKKVKA